MKLPVSPDGNRLTVIFGWSVMFYWICKTVTSSTEIDEYGRVLANKNTFGRNGLHPLLARQLQ